MWKRFLAVLFGRSRFHGLMISPSPYVDDGNVLLKRHGHVVAMGLLQYRPSRHDDCDEIVVSASDWHAIREGRA